MLLGRSGLAGGRPGDLGRRPGPFLDDVLQDAVDFVGDVRREHPRLVRRSRGDNRAVGADDLRDRDDVRALPARSERRVRTRHLERRNAERSERDRADGLERARDTRVAGGLQGRLGPDLRDDLCEHRVDRVLRRAHHGHPAIAFVVVIGGTPRAVGTVTTRVADRDPARSIER